MIKQPIILPPAKTWNEPNTGFLFGSVYQTMNVSMDVAGILSLSKRSNYIGREDASSSGYDYLLSVVYDGRGLTGAVRYYMLTSDKLYRMTNALGSFQVDPTSSQPTFLLDSSDAVLWTDGLYCSTSSDVSKLVSGAWSGSQMPFSTSSVPHPLCASASANYLLGGDANVLHQKDPSTGTVSVSLTLPSNYRIQWIRSDYSRTLIGCRNMNGGNTAVFEWDEVSPTWTNKFDIDCSWVYTGEFRNTDFFCVTNDGRLMKFNGGGFSLAAQWPIYKTLQGSWIDGFVLGSVFQRGMQITGGRVQVLINGDINSNSSIYPNMWSGVWEFDESSGLNHKYGMSWSQSSEDFAQGVLSAGAGAMGQIVIDPINGPPSSAVGGTLLYGARLNDAAVDYYVLSSIVSTGTNRGSFVTTRIETADIADDSKKLWVKYRGVYTSSDFIIFKLKEKVRNGIPFCVDNQVTWVSSTVFTTNSSDAAQWANVLPGDEVTVASGHGAGAAANILSINGPSASVYTVTLDEAIPSIVASDFNFVVVDNFRRLETQVALADTETQWKGIPLQQTDPSDWVQVKVEMRGSYQVTVEELQLVPTNHVLPTA